MGRFPELWLKFADEVERRSRLPSEQVLSLLSAIEAPPSLSGLTSVCTLLRGFLPTQTTLVSLNHELTPSDPNQLARWWRVCDVIAGAPTAYDTALTEIAPKESSAFKGTLRGEIEAHQIYATLWSSKKVAEQHRQQYEILLVQLLLASIGAAKIIDPTKHQAAKVWAGQVARRLLKQKFNREISGESVLSRLPIELCTATEYRDALTEMVGAKPDLYPLKRIVALINYGLTGKEAKKSKHPASFLSEDILLDDTPEEPTLVAEVSIRKLQKMGDQKFKEFVRSGCAPSEAAAPAEVVQRRDTKARQRTASMSRRRKVVHARAVVSALAAYNQLLPSDRRCLVPYETAVLLGAIQKMSLGTDCGLNKSAVPNPELAAVLAALLFTGRPLRDLANCSIMRREPRGDKIPIAYVWSGQHGYWSVVPAKPERQSKLSDAAKPQAEAMIDRLPLRTVDGSCAEEIIDLYVSKLPKTGRGNHTLFGRDAKAYEDAVKGFLRGLNHRHGTRLTLGRVARHLFHRLSARSGSDATAAAMITGRNEPVARTPLHYCAAPVRELQTLYATESSDIVASAEREGHLAIDRSPSEHALPRDGYIGSLYRPTRQCLITLFKSLQTRVQVARSIRDEKEQAIALHNAVTLYTHWTVALSTGYRAVTNAFFDDTEIDRETGFGVISDKDGDDYYHTRLVWLPPRVIGQIDLWIHHWDFFWRHRLEAVNPALDDELKAKYGCGEKSGKRRKRDHTAGNSVAGFFFFDAEGQTVEPTPDTISEYTGSDFLLPLNAGRHYLRSRLFELACPAEVTAAFMGHWERGEEPWGRYSGMSPVIYRDALAPHVETILNEIGWKAEPGLGRRSR